MSLPNKNKRVYFLEGMFPLTWSTYNVVDFGDFLCPDIFDLGKGGGGYYVVMVKTYVYVYFYLFLTIFYLSTSYPAYQIEKKDHIFRIFVSISYIIMDYGACWFSREMLKKTILTNHKSKRSPTMHLFLSVGKPKQQLWVTCKYLLTYLWIWL